MKCPACGSGITEEMKFCSQCGAGLQRTCPSCGAPDQSVMSPCAACGHVPEEAIPSMEKRETPPRSAPCLDDLSLVKRFLTPQLADKILAARGRIEGERRQVTALFADIQGYTPLSESLGEEATFKVMERIYECMITSVLGEEGSVQELTGDGIFALFGAPIALEDAPVRACRAALALQEKMRSLGDELHAGFGIRPLARIGIHTGPVVIGTLGTDLRMEFKAVGDTVNLASRLESLAEPGHIFISEATYGLVAPFVDCLCMGEQHIKGKAEPQKVYHLEGIKEQALRFEASLQRGLTPLAGRSEELDLLEHYCDKAGHGSPLLVLVIGEAGVGKSRLVYELKKRIERRKFLFLQSNCTSYGRAISLMPFIHLVKNLLRINDGDDRTVMERKVRQGLELFGMDSTASKPYLLALLGIEEKDTTLRSLDAKLMGERTRETIISLLRNRCRLCPAVLVVEDLHWIDQTSENLLGQIVREKDQLPLLILCTARPSYSSPWDQVPNVREVRLESLSRQSTVDMVKALLGCDSIDDGLSRVIIEETGCNPLYTEEITRYLLDSGAINRTGRTASCGLAAGEVRVPSTILDLLQTRIDRLEEAPKALLQSAAVIGQRFSPELARLVSGLGESFDRHLCALGKWGLIVREQIEDQVVYRFKHALLQDAVYNSLLRERRERLHQLVGETMERLYSDRLNEWAHTLAHHWANTLNTCKAVQYLAMAGEKSYWVCAMEEAHQRFGKALELIEAEPGCVDDHFIADVLIKWGRVYLYRANFIALNALLEPYLPKMEALGDQRRLSLVLSWLALSHVFAGHGTIAKPLLERALAIAEETGDAECIAMAARSLVWLYTCWIPDNVQSEAMAARYYALALESAEKVNDIIVMIGVTVARSRHLEWLGRFPEARSYSSKLVEIGRRYRDTRSLSYAQWSLGFTNLCEERYQEALECAEQSLQLSPDLLDELCASGVKGAALSFTGRISEGLEILSKVRQNIIKTGFLPLLAGIDIPYGAVLVLAGHLEKGVRHLNDAIEYWTSLGNYTVPVWGHLALGDVYARMAMGTMKLSPAAIVNNLRFLVRNLPFARRSACHHYEHVVRSARAFNMPWLLARALYSLGTLSQARHRQEEARAYYEEALETAETSRLYIAENIRFALDSLEKGKR
jgi:class 3 adenylate cyclase/tetratricopeptide (TPR) repeat protein